jgi:hypothetical protein
MRIPNRTISRSSATDDVSLDIRPVGVGHAFVQNLRRGHYELGVEARHKRLRVAAAFDELAAAI